MPAFLFDLDGVVYNGEIPIEGASEAISWVREQGFPFMFITNTTSRPRRELVHKLSVMGIETDISRIMTPARAAADWLKQNIAGHIALFTTDAVKEEFRDFRQLPEDAEEGAEAVIIGDLGEKWNFSELNRAFRLLVSDSRPFLIALGMTRFWMAPDGLRLDTAPFVAALEKASNIKPIVLGKPEKRFFKSAIERIDADPDETYMIGDDIISDMQGAQRVGLKGILVRTGKFREEDLNQGIVPDGVMDSIADLPQWWRKLKTSYFDSRNNLIS